MGASVGEADGDRLPISGGAGRAPVGELGPIDLAREALVRLGPLEIDPRRRRVAHDDGREEIIEPRVMQVLVALIKTDGRILTRDELLMSCWRGVVVGEDALNRVIGRVRRVSTSLGEGVFEIETITRAGYRLVVSTVDQNRLSSISASGERPALALPTKPSIAVLPLKNLSGDPSKDYLAEAISEEIITALSRWRWFFVIAGRSSFTYRDQDADPIRIGKELGVRYLVSGGVRVSGKRVRVTVQLIDALNGANVWADKFDYELVDIFDLQDDVTEHVAAAIEPAMLQGERIRTEHKSVADFGVLDCFYQGMWHLNLMTLKDEELALSLFREAVRLDPSVALGHVGVARLLYGRALFLDPAVAVNDFRESLASAQTAIGLDPREATAYFAAAGAELYLGDHAAAMDGARQALALNPNFAYAHYRLGQVLIFGGQPDQAIAPIERSLSLSPCDPQVRLMLETLALAHYQAGDYEAALTYARRAGRSVRGEVSTLLVAALAQLGRFAEAVDALDGLDLVRGSRRRPAGAPYAVEAHREHIRDGFRLAREAQKRGL